MQLHTVCVYVCDGMQAAMAVASLEAAVDTLIIISNDRLLKGA